MADIVKNVFKFVRRTFNVNQPFNQRPELLPTVQPIYDMEEANKYPVFLKYSSTGTTKQTIVYVPYHWKLFVEAVNIARTNAGTNYIAIYDTGQILPLNSAVSGQSMLLQPKTTIYGPATLFIDSQAGTSGTITHQIYGYFSPHSGAVDKYILDPSPDPLFSDEKWFRSDGDD